MFIIKLIIPVILFFAMNGNAMAKGIFIHSQHPTSKRFVILDESERVAYLYLTDKGKQIPVKDALAYMRVTAPNKVDWKNTAKEGHPPILSKEFASDSAVIKNAKEGQFSFEWSDDGESASLNYNGNPIAFVSVKKSLGYSKAISKPNKLALPWDEKIYIELFGN